VRRASAPFNLTGEETIPWRYHSAEGAIDRNSGADRCDLAISWDQILSQVELVL
jgi:hypothetical protein